MGFDLGQVRKSVTIWQGELDTWLPMRHARRLASLLPNSTLEVVAGAVTPSRLMYLTRSSGTSRHSGNMTRGGMKPVVPDGICGIYR